MTTPTTALRILARRGVVADEQYHEPTLVDIHGPETATPILTLPRVLDLDSQLRAQLHTIGAAQEPEAAALDELRAGLTHLVGLPVDRLARHLSGCLDLFAYRLDAWITALATRQLQRMRRQRPRGVALGGGAERRYLARVRDERDAEAPLRERGNGQADPLDGDRPLFDDVA